MIQPLPMRSMIGMPARTAGGQQEPLWLDSKLSGLDCRYLSDLAVRVLIFIPNGNRHSVCAQTWVRSLPALNSTPVRSASPRSSRQA